MSHLQKCADSAHLKSWALVFFFFLCPWLLFFNQLLYSVFIYIYRRLLMTANIHKLRIYIVRYKKTQGLINTEVLDRCDLMRLTFYIPGFSSNVSVQGGFVHYIFYEMKNRTCILLIFRHSHLVTIPGLDTFELTISWGHSNRLHVVFPACATFNWSLDDLDNRKVHSPKSSF